MVIKCHENLSFTIAPPAVHPNAYTVNETIKIFHEFRNLKKVKGWKHLYSNMRKANLMKMAFTTLIRELKKIENDETYVSNIKANDSLLVIKEDVGDACQ